MSKLTVSKSIILNKYREVIYDITSQERDLIKQKSMLEALKQEKAEIIDILCGFKPEEKKIVNTLLMEYGQPLIDF